MMFEGDKDTMGGSSGPVRLKIEVCLLDTNFDTGVAGSVRIAELLGYQARSEGRKISVSLDGKDWFPFPNLCAKVCPEREATIEDLGLVLDAIEEQEHFCCVGSRAGKVFITKPYKSLAHARAAALYSALLIKSPVT